MRDSNLQQIVLDRFGLRLEPEMTAYLAGKIQAGDTSEIPVMGGDARTGISRRQLIPASALATVRK